MGTQIVRTVVDILIRCTVYTYLRVSQWPIHMIRVVPALRMKCLLMLYLPRSN